MYPRNLKSHIAVSVFTALLIAMLLTNIVVSALWYKSQVQQKIETTVKILEQASRLEVHAGNVLPNDYDIKLSRVVRNFLDVSVKQIVVEVLREEMSQTGNLQSTMYDESLQSAVQLAVKNEKTVVERIEKTSSVFVIQPMFIAVAVPFQSQDRVQGGIGILLSTRSIVDAMISKQAMICVYILLNAIILATLVFFRMRKVLLDPVDKLMLQADNYHLSEGIGLFSEYSPNEFGQLSRAMQNMVRKIEKDRDQLRESVGSLKEANARLRDARDEIVHAEKLASLGRLSAGLAHEIGNPVAIVQGYLELIERDDVSDGERRQFIKRGLDELLRIDTLLKQLLEMARSSASNQEPVDLAESIKKSLDLLQLPITRNCISVKTEFPGEKCTIWADRDKIQQLLLNFLLNSIDAIAEKNEEHRIIEVTIHPVFREKDTRKDILLTIRDSGIGIDEENLELIFEPFFTTKEPGQGTGLGMAVANRIIRSFGGTIRVASQKGAGAEFVITFPAYEPAYVPEDDITMVTRDV
ncbi:sensor histidine kinase [Desulfosediminicola ganghwensis]|uniref:sensor histidine kinase n=1 Tax=Desulfosediminicola ganghwensis TaxID=2569540 RepID=UPI0010AD85BF|nr:ATP-binding protein [Desulfosediminicola ganghwensis]